MKSYMIQCLSRAESPISHMARTSGNEAVISSEPVRTATGVVDVPVLSGNALRHRTVREPMAMWLIETYGLAGKLSLDQLNFLLHGGNLTESTATENTQRIAECHRLWPMIRLCGGSLPNQILAGSLDVWRGTLLCEENRLHLQQSLADTGPWLSARHWDGRYQYTRGDATKTGLSTEPRNDRPSNLMIYSGQCVTKGAWFHHGYVLHHASILELGCLLLALRLWQSRGGTVGGQSRIGHGRLTTYWLDFDDCGEAVDVYVEHVNSCRDEASQWLNDVFTAKNADKTRKRRKSAEMSP